jgi:eukaryotic-like serine/threonine-protein kinase
LEALPVAVNLIGKTLHGYVVRRVLGEGGMGVVYEGYRADLEKRAAIKVLNRDYASPEHAARFVNEAIGTSRVKQPGFDYTHENVVNVEHVGTHEGQPFIVFEFLEGRDLERVIASHWRNDAAVGTSSDPIAVDYAASILLQICRVLDAAHPRIVHRDLKPANVFITRRPGRDPFVKLLDFGIAKLRSDIRATGVATGVGGIMGTPLYMAPEQAARPLEVDHRADLFALGALMYELLTGRAAYAAYDGFAAIHAAKTEGALPPPVTHFRPDLDPRWNAIVCRLLSPDPASRYPNVRMLAQDIAAAMPGGAELFAAVWPDFHLSPDDATVPNDGTVLPSPRLTPPPRSAMTSHAAAAGARPPTAATPTRRWAVGGLAMFGAAILALAVVAMSRGDAQGNAREAENAQAVSPSATASASPAAQSLQVLVDAGVAAASDASPATSNTTGTAPPLATVETIVKRSNRASDKAAKERNRRPARRSPEPEVREALGGPRPPVSVEPAHPIDAGRPVPRKTRSKDDLLLGR